MNKTRHYIKTKHAVRIKVSDSGVDSSYSYKREHRIFGICIQREGIYWNGFRGPRWECSLEDIRTEHPNHFVEDGTVYEKADVTIYLLDETRITKYFDTYDEAVAYGKEIAKECGKTIEIK